MQFVSAARSAGPSAARRPAEKTASATATQPSTDRLNLLKSVGYIAR